MLDTKDKNSYWYTTNGELLELDPRSFHSNDVLKYVSKLNIPDVEIEDWLTDNFSDEIIIESIKKHDFKKIYDYIDSRRTEHFGNDHFAKGLKLLSLKHGNISIRTLYTDIDKTFKVVISYYGRFGLKILQNFVVDYYDLFNGLKIITYDITTGSYFFYNSIKDLINEINKE